LRGAFFLTGIIFLGKINRLLYFGVNLLRISLSWLPISFVPRILADFLFSTKTLRKMRIYNLLFKQGWNWCGWGSMFNLIFLTEKFAFNFALRNLDRLVCLICNLELMLIGSLTHSIVYFKRTCQIRLRFTGLIMIHISRFLNWLCIIISTLFLSFLRQTFVDLGIWIIQ
jgi:hypothetical protein